MMTTAIKKIMVIAGLICLSGVAGYTQFVYDYLKAGDGYFAKADYASAADYYEKYLGTDKESTGNRKGYDPYAPQLPAAKKETAVSSKQKALWQLAECYRLLHYPAKAETAYRKVQEAGKQQFPLAGFYQAQQLRALGKYEEAEVAFTAFIGSYQQQDAYTATAGREIKNLQFIRKELNKPEVKYYKVQPAGGALSSTGANYAPVWVDSATLLFTSTRKTQGGASGKHVNQLYQVQFAGDSSAQTPAPGLLQIKGMEQGIAAVTAGGTTVYFTRWHATGNKEAAIYVSTRQGITWSEPAALPAAVNAPGYSSQQPFVTKDGHYLLFASNKPGGQGGFDIWYAPLDADGKLGAPVNGGAVINTAEDEQTPYYDGVSHTLVFASNGRIGMGGYDLFTSKGAPGSFEEPVNMGYPVNSVKDDIYFATKGNAGDLFSDMWLSSDRSEACCLELFAVSRKLPEPEKPVTPPVKEPVIVAEKPVTPDTMVPTILENVYYAYDKAELLDGSEASLNKLVQMLTDNPNMVIEISGHTDSKGSDVYNQKLSLARAQTCVDYIVSKGIARERVLAKGYGAARPVAPNTHADGSDNPEGREKNRRTEFIILKK